MKFLVQERFQDSGWETVESFDGIRAAVSGLEEVMKCHLSGMGRIVKILPEGFGHGSVVIVELPGCGWTKDAAEKLQKIYPAETIGGRTTGEERQGGGMVKQVIAREFVVTQSDIVDSTRRLAVGEKYVYFEDTDTGKLYRPVEGFIVSGDDLSDRFVEVKCR